MGVRSVFPLLLGLSFDLDGLCGEVNALLKGRVCAPSAVVMPGQAREGQNIGGGDSEDRELGKLLVVREGRHCATQSVKRGTDCVNARAFAGIRLNPALPRHVLVVALLLLPRRSLKKALNRAPFSTGGRGGRRACVGVL